MNIPWLRFEWNLEKLKPISGEMTAPFVIRQAQKDEEDVVQKVAASAFSMDTGFGDLSKAIAEQLEEHVNQSFGKEKTNCLVLLHGSRIIGVSALNVTEDSENHLLTGPCVLHEYRSRGLGSQLLESSLYTLRDAGLKRAYGISRPKTTVARYIYPKFGGVSTPCTPGFEVLPKLAA